MVTNIQKLIDDVESLKRQGRHEEALSKLFELQKLYKDKYGTESTSFRDATIQICQIANLIGMSYLQNNNTRQALTFLKLAEQQRTNEKQWCAVTFNNLACYYRTIGQLRNAQEYLKKTLDLQLNDNNPSNIADTHLNLCATLSQLSHHDDALQSGLLATVLLQGELIDSMENQSESERSDNRIVKNSLSDRKTALAIAYFNTGAEWEHLKQRSEALDFYTTGLRYAEKNLSKTSQVTEKLCIASKKMKEEIQRSKQETKEMPLPSSIKRSDNISNKERHAGSNEPRQSVKNNVKPIVQTAMPFDAFDLYLLDDNLLDETIINEKSNSNRQSEKGSLITNESKSESNSFERNNPM